MATRSGFNVVSAGQRRRLHFSCTSSRSPPPLPASLRPAPQQV